VEIERTVHNSIVMAIIMPKLLKLVKI